MPKFTIFICVALCVQTRCFIKEYGLHNHTFHYAGTHSACYRAGAVGEPAGMGLSSLAHTNDPSAGVPTLHRPGRAQAGLCSPRAARPLPLQATQETVQKRIQHLMDSPLAKGTICSLASSGQEWQSRQARGKVTRPEHPLLPGSLLTHTGSPKLRCGMCATWQTPVPSLSHCPSGSSFRSTAAATAVPWGACKSPGPDHLPVLRQNFQAEDGGFRQLDSTEIKKQRSLEESCSLAMSSSYSLP